jgi:hypothetical protein
MIATEQTRHVGGESKGIHPAVLKISKEQIAAGLRMSVNKQMYNSRPKIT